MAHMDSGAAQCVMHTHEAYVTALSSLKCGLLPLTQTALIAGPVAYHPYGPPLSENECESMVENMGDALVLVMENHVSSVLPLSFGRRHSQQLLPEPLSFGPLELV